MFNYAQIENNVVVGISSLSGQVTAANMVQLDSTDDANTGDIYDAETGTFSTPTPVAPGPRLRLTKGEFRDQFTTAEKQAIYTAAETSVDIKIFLDDLMAVNHVDLDFPKTINSVNALESLGLIGTGRAAEILSGI